MVSEAMNKANIHTGPSMAYKTARIRIKELEQQLAAIKEKARAAVNAPYEDILDMGLAQALRELKEAIPE